VLENKVAIITGAGGGIGSATARAFARSGAKLALVDQDEASLDGLHEMLRSDGIDDSQIEMFAADVTDADQVESYVNATSKRFGEVQVLFNNAGILGPIAPVEEYDIAAFDRLIAINLRGIWLNLHFAVPAILAAGGGSIINTSSAMGKTAIAGLGPYCLSKHGVIGLTRSVALELATKGVRVNAVCPGPIDTEMMAVAEREVMPDDPSKAHELFVASIPMGHYGSPDDIAAAVLFLASDASGFMTGAALSVDGGWVIQ
jgi:NAD(P)-dependent dehydrogenase (short-subunit alcohol dehydrogenase family)